METLQATERLFADSLFTPFVAASIEEVRQAQELRERLKQLYPDRPNRPVSAWSVGVD